MEYPHKDQFTVVKAMDFLVKEYKDDVNLVFVGDGPDRNRNEDLVSTMGAETRTRIHFEGSRMDVQNYYKAANILVHASVAGEGLPTIIIEGLANELPMVVTDSKTGPREILGNDDYGLLCNIKDPADMANKLHRLLSDDELYNDYKIKSKERLRDFLPATIQKQLDELLRSIYEG